MGGGRWGTQSLSSEPVPYRVGVAYVSIRVTPQSTARAVVLEVLPLFGRQVCTLGLPSSTQWGKPLSLGVSLGEGLAPGLTPHPCCTG